MSGRPAAFLDRDGTLIRELEYLADPARVELLPGAATAVRELGAAGLLIVIVTNQSGIARGFYTETEFEAVQAELVRQLAAEGARVDAVYHCPHHPEYTGPCECRKPRLGMFRTAAVEWQIDLSRSVYIGDRLRDVMPALELGGRGYLVRTGYGAEEREAAPGEITVVADIAEAARLVTSGVDRATRQP